MHRLMLVTFKVDMDEDINTSEKARIFVTQWLNENGFAGESGRFISPTADWFVVGGRWSGYLTFTHLDQENHNQFLKECGDEKLWFIKQDSENKVKVEAKFAKFFPDYIGPAPAVWRDQYNLMGAEDDAMIVDQVIYDNLLKHKMDDVEQFCDVDDGLNNQSLPEDIIGKYYVVVIDYHN